SLRSSRRVPCAPLFPYTTLFRSEPWLLLMALLTSAIAITEVALYAFTGSIVDRLSSHTPDTFWAEEGWKFAGMAVVVLVVMPLLDRKSTRLNSSHVKTSYAVFCL